jgi:hypothetical protein
MLFYAIIVENIHTNLMHSSFTVRERLLGGILLLTAIVGIGIVSPALFKVLKAQVSNVCSNGIDDDSDGFTDRGDWGCSKSDGISDFNELMLATSTTFRGTLKRNEITTLKFRASNHELIRSAQEVTIDMTLPAGFEFIPASSSPSCNQDRMFFVGLGIWKDIIRCSNLGVLHPEEQLEEQLVTLKVKEDAACGTRTIDIYTWDIAASDRTANDQDIDVRVECNSTTDPNYYCVDSDGGHVSNIAGNVKTDPNSTAVKRDYCKPFDNSRTTENQLVEYSCGINSVAEGIANCPYLCRDGACIAPGETLPNAGKTSVERIWLTRDPECNSWTNGVPDDCVDFHLWVDARNIAGNVPASQSDLEVILHEWSDTHGRFLQGGMLGRYAYNGNRNELYFSTTYGHLREHLPRSQRVLIEVHQRGSRAIREAELIFDENIEVAGYTGMENVPLQTPEWAVPERQPQLQLSPEWTKGPSYQQPYQLPIPTELINPTQRAPMTPVIETPMPTAVPETLHSAAGFPDVDPQSDIGRAAKMLADRGIISGYPDGTFGADRPVNRAEAAKFLLLARYGQINTNISTLSFSDEIPGSWYIPYVEQAALSGVISGYPDGTFGPGKTVNTAEFMKMLTLAFELRQDFPQAFSDVPADSWFVQYTGPAFQYRLFPPRGFTLMPGKPLTRGEVAYAIARILSR